ncbi:MAG: hypothetical protein ABJR46_12280 [Tateyamaria sp.]|uniref:hypothetical protein n=1 Tax=Tateyamaria sp. TaxID=1929288 RepID=UPI00329F36FD
MSDHTDIVCLSVIPAHETPVIKTQLKRDAALQTAADQIFAINNSCLHKVSPQTKGIVQRTDAGQIRFCPLRINAGRTSLTASHLRAGSTT